MSMEQKYKRLLMSVSVGFQHSNTAKQNKFSGIQQKEYSHALMWSVGAVLPHVSHGLKKQVYLGHIFIMKKIGKSQRSV